MFDWSGAFSVLGMLSISVALIVMGLLSSRLGRVTKAKAYHIGFYVASLLVAIGGIARLANLTDKVAVQTNLHNNVLWVLLYNGTPATGITLGLILAWRYWSWLLTERD